MAKAEAAIERLALADGKDTSRRRDPAVAHDHAAVVEGRFRVEQSQEQLGAEKAASTITPVSS